LDEFRRSYQESGYLAVNPLCRIYLEDVYSGKDTLHDFSICASAWRSPPVAAPCLFPG